MAQCMRARYVSLVLVYPYVFVDGFADGSVYEGQVCVSSAFLCMYIHVCVCV